MNITEEMRNKCIGRTENYVEEFTLDEGKKAVLNMSIELLLTPAKKYLSMTSYGIKLVFEDVLGYYISNADMKLAMLENGYEPEDYDKLNWTFKISYNSGLFANKLYRYKRLVSVLIKWMKKENMIV